MNYALILLLAFCGLAIVAARRALQKQRITHLLPGPKGLPILGNLLQVPSQLFFLKVVEWAQEYGPIYSYSLLGQPIIVLNTAKAACDILDRMSGKTSDRPQMIKMNDYLCRNNEYAFIPANATWRMHRRAAHETLNINAVQAMRPMQEDEAHLLVEGIIRHPEISVIDHSHRHSTSIAWRAVYGHEAIPLEGPNPSAPLDDLIKELFLAAIPGGSIVDIFPPLKHVIDRSKLLRSQGDKVYKELTAFFTKAFSDKQVEGQPSFSRNLKETGEKLGFTSAEDCGWSGGTLFVAAQDTTATALRWFFLAMLLFPDVVTAAQAELNSVVGDRPPTFANRQALPQIDAILKEILRWRPPTPTGVAHYVAEDITYGDYVIPKGAFILPNTWSMCRDPQYYSDGDAFEPSRFLDENGQLKQAQKDTHDDYLVFGHGRRVCVGKNLALNSLWIAFAYLLWAFDFKKARDAQGNEITPDAFDFVDHGVTVWPNHFPIVLAPRFPDLAERLKAHRLETNSD